MNKGGPKMNPCGTPAGTGNDGKDLPLHDYSKHPAFCQLSGTLQCVLNAFD